MADHADPEEPSCSVPTDSSPTADQRRKHGTRRTVPSYYGFLILCLVLGLNLFAVRLLNLPLNRIIELRYCKQYYLEHDISVIDPGGNVPEEMCKIEEIQQKLAWLDASIGTSIMACDLIVTLPYGAVSDRLGRKLILILNSLATTTLFAWFLLVGKVDSIPVEAMIAAPFLALFGGGECVFTSIVFAYLTDFAKDTAERTTYFALAGSLQYAFSLLGPIIAATMMSLDLWIPFYLGLGLLIVSLPIIALLPHSQTFVHDQVNSDAGDGAEETPLLNGTSGHDQNGSANLSRTETTLKTTIKSTIVTQVRDTIGLITGRPGFQQLLAIVFVLALASSNTNVLIFYLSKRYDRTFAEVGYLLSVKAGINILLLTIILPTFLKFWARRNPDSQVAADFVAAEASFFISFIGSLVLALAGQLWLAIIALVIYALGTAAFILILSLVKSPVASLEGDNHATGRDYSIVVMTRSIGALIGTPLMAAIWVKDLAVGGGNMGLPYFATAVLFLVGWGLVRNLRMPWIKMRA